MKRFGVTLLLLAALTPLPGRADSRAVYLTGQVFSPDVREAVAGDEIDFQWVAGTHTVTAYLGASFDSGAREAGDEFLFSYAGGIVHYRCTLHSRLADAFRCTGMCGVITDRPLESEPPKATIDAPTQNTLITPDLAAPSLTPSVTVHGAATDDTSVAAVVLRLYDTTGKGTEYPTTCTGCGTPSATWTVTRALPPGSYVAEAIPVDDSGNVPPLPEFPRAQFFVL